MYLPASQTAQADKADVLYVPAEHTVHVYEKSDPDTVPLVLRAAPFVAVEDV
jgi:hypothetical protein